MVAVVVVVMVDRGAKLSFLRGGTKSAGRQIAGGGKRERALEPVRVSPSFVTSPNSLDLFVRLYYKYETLQHADPLVDGKRIHPGVVLGGELLAGAKARGAHHLAAPAARDAPAPVLHAASHARPARQVPWRANESASEREAARYR